MAAGDITIDSRYLECSPTPGGFPIAGRNTTPRQEVRYHQPSGHDDITQDPIPEGTPAAVTTSPGAAMYPPYFDPVPGAYSGHLVSGHPSSSSLVNSGIVLPANSAHQNEGNGLSTSRLLLTSQSYQDTLTLSTTAVPILGVEVDQHPNRHQCTVCDAKYAWPSGLNRHYKDVHLPWISCDFCGLEFSSGRRYLLTKHLETDHPNA